MRTRRIRVWIFICCGVATVLILTFWRQREPQYHGRSLSQWLLLLNGGYSNEPDISRHDAEEAIRLIGTNGLPFLVQWINYREPPWHTRAQTLCNNMPQIIGSPLSRLLLGQRGELQWLAIWNLYLFGADAQPAVPALTNLMASQPRYTPSCVLALAQIGGDALTPVLNVLTNQANPQRLFAISALAELDTRHPLDPTIVSTLTNFLADTNREFAICAAQILSSHDSQKDLAMNTLVDSLGNKNKNVRQAAMSRLRVLIKSGYSVPTLLQFAPLSLRRLRSRRIG
jgi:hypothetical protein